MTSYSELLLGRLMDRPSWTDRLLLLLSIFVVFFMAACTTVDVAVDPATGRRELNFLVPVQLNEDLNNSSPCCDSLASLPYQSVNRQGAIDVRIDTDTPTFLFATGKSRFAAFRLPNWPRPLAIAIESFRTPDPRGLGFLLPELRGLIFHPVVLILDEKFRVVQTLTHFDSGPDCQKNEFLAALSGEFEIDSDPAKSAYIVVLTTDEYRATSGPTVCGAKLNGYSPIGNLEITFKSLGFGDGQIAYKAPFYWYPGAHGNDDVGMFAGLFKSSDTLMVTGDGLHLVRWTSEGYKEVFSVSNDHLVSVNAEFRSNEHQERLLKLAVEGASPGAIEYHTFLAADDASPNVVASLLTPRVRPARYTEKVGISVLNLQPEVNLVEVKSASAAARSLGESAVAGGMVVAMPCGLCQTGACTPEMLIPCAALFAVGAAVGGAIGIGNQVLHGVPPADPQPQISQSVAAATLSTIRTSSASILEAVHLEQCLKGELKKYGLGDASTLQWVSQGRRAEVNAAGMAESLVQGDSTYINSTEKGYRFVSEIRIEKLNLIAQGAPGQAILDMPVYLEVKGRVVYRDMTRSIHRDLPLTWKSDAKAWSAWSAVESTAMTTTLNMACEQVVRQAIDATQATWMDW